MISAIFAGGAPMTIDLVENSAMPRRLPRGSTYPATALRERHRRRRTDRKRVLFHVPARAMRRARRGGVRVREFSVPPVATIDAAANLTDPVWRNADEAPGTVQFARRSGDTWAD